MIPKSSNGSVNNDVVPPRAQIYLMAGFFFGVTMTVTIELLIALIFGQFRIAVN